MADNINDELKDLLLDETSADAELTEPEVDIDALLAEVANEAESTMAEIANETNMDISVDEIPTEDLPMDIPVEDLPMDIPVEDIPIEIPAEEPIAEPEIEIPADIPVEEPTLEEAPTLEEEPTLEEIPTSEVDELDITLEIPTNDTSTMSVEEIVSNVNDTSNTYDFSSTLEISIGENGGSYIAMNLPSDMINDKLEISASGTLPAMLMGNCISVAVDNQIVRCNLFTGEITVKETEACVVAAMNSSISPVAERNTSCIENYPYLSEYLNYMFSIAEKVDDLNEALDMSGSLLSITVNDDGIFSVVEPSGVVHSLEEVLWVLSL